MLSGLKEINFPGLNFLPALPLSASIVIVVKEIIEKWFLLQSSVHARLLFANIALKLLPVKIKKINLN